MHTIFLIFSLLLPFSVFANQAGPDISHCIQVMQSKNVTTFVPLDKKVQKPEWRRYDAENIVPKQLQKGMRYFFNKQILLGPVTAKDLNTKHFDFIQPKKDHFVFQGRLNKITAKITRDANGRMESYYIQKENAGHHLQFRKKVTFSWENNTCTPVSFEIEEKRKDFRRNFEVHISHKDKVALPLCKEIYPRVKSHIKDFEDYPSKKRSESGMIFSFPEKHSEMLPKTRAIYQELLKLGVEFTDDSIISPRTQIKPLFLLVDNYYLKADLEKLDKLLAKFKACENFYDKNERLLNSAPVPPSFNKTINIPINSPTGSSANDQ